MPSKNAVKQYVEQSFYHVYNRGVEKRNIFIDDQDYAVFLNLLKRYLSPEEHKDDRGNIYESYAERVELLAFCLMPNHFHLLFYLNSDPKAIAKMMQKVTSSYTTYFNKRHVRVGHLLQGVYKASHILEDAYLLHISRYIHLNPESYKSWEFSSLPYYINGWRSDWVKPGRILELFDGTESYENFIEDYEDHKHQLESIKVLLADT
ncbi:MAG: transposase [Candidatus Saccharibacteria bacterium]|nr:transposase [Candidatus Saccharibacteria bacterium]